MSATPSTPTARHTAALIQQGRLAADTVALATLNHIAEADRSLGAFVCLPGPDAAAAQARQLQQAGGPLAGVPVAVKDIFDTCDLATGYGSPIYPPRPALADAAVVAVLRRAGGLVIGKSSTT